MKKTIVVLGLMLTLSITSTFANEIEVAPQVLESFNNEFSTAKDVNWLEGDHFYKAAFTFNGQHVFAYYAKDGKLLSIARYISSIQLPIHLMSDLKKEYSDYWISDLFEAYKSNETFYYITLENADKTIMLVSDNGSGWKTYQKKTKV